MASYGGFNRNPPMRPGNGRGFQRPPPSDYNYPPQGSGYQQQWGQDGHDVYDHYSTNNYNEYQEGPYSDQRRPYQEPPVQSRRSYDQPRPGVNSQPIYSNGRPDPRNNYQDQGPRFAPGDPNANRPQSSRQYNERNAFQPQYRESEGQPRSQDYERGYGPPNGRAWQDPNAQSQYSRERPPNGGPLRDDYASNDGYGSQKEYRSEQAGFKRRTPPQAVSERVRKPLIEPTSPSEMNYDNPFPMFPTKKNNPRTDNAAAADAISGRVSQETRRPEVDRPMLQEPGPTREPLERQNGNGHRYNEGRHASLGGAPLPRAETLPLRPIETNFSRNIRSDNQQQWQAPVTATELQPPRAQFSVPQRPGSAPGIRSPPLGSGTMPSADRSTAQPPGTRDQRPPVGRQVSDSAFNTQNQSYQSSGERMPNFDKAEPRRSEDRGVPLHVSSKSPETTPQQTQYQHSSANAAHEAAYANLSGNPFESENGDWEQSQPRRPSNQAYDDGFMIQRAATAYQEPLSRPPPRRQMTADSHFSDPGAGFGGPGSRGPGGMPRPPYNDPRGQYGGAPTGGPPQRFEQDQRNFDGHGQRGYDGPGAGYNDREIGGGPQYAGIPPAGTRVDGLRGGPPNGPGFRPRPPGSRPGDSFERQQSFPRDPNASRGPGSGIQPRPPPVRPGLNGNPPSMAGSRPPPIRQYDSNSSVSTSHPQRTSSDPSRNSAEKPQAPPPVTQAELSRMREAMRASPTNSKIQMELVKKLIEASVVLADEGGRADARTTSKNRANFTAEAQKILKRLTSNGHPEAMFFFADGLSSGSLGLENDPKEAFSLYQQAAKAGHAASAYRTAVCCEIGPEDGGGTRKDPVKAMQWYKRAAALGDVPAMFKLGMIQVKGLLGQERNVVEGCTWLKRAADKADEENPHALHELALLYESGEGPSNMPRDPAMALQLFSQAAKLGLKSSQFRLGQAYEYGLLGCPVDARNSIVWYTRAAAQGEHQSELALSGWYLTGSDGILEHSDTEAYLWARKAAQAHPPLPKAMFAMGYFTEVGIGCPRSLEEAKRWYGRAASHRFPKAQERLEELKRGGIKMNGGRQQLSRTNKQQTDAECVVM